MLRPKELTRVVNRLRTSFSKGKGRSLLPNSEVGDLFARGGDQDAEGDRDRSLGHSNAARARFNSSDGNVKLALYRVE